MINFQTEVRSLFRYVLRFFHSSVKNDMLYNAIQSISKTLQTSFDVLH